MGGGYFHNAGGWSEQMASLGDLIGTPYSIMCDDDGLINPHAVASAAAILDEEPLSIGVAGILVEFAKIRNRVGWMDYPTFSTLLEYGPPLARFQALFQSFTAAPFYGVFRTQTLVDALKFKATLHEGISTRNVQTPLFLAYLALSGPIIRSSLVSVARDVSVPPHDKQLMNLWVGDWLTGSEYQSEVERVRASADEAALGLGIHQDDIYRATHIFEDWAKAIKIEGASSQLPVPHRSLHESIQERSRTILSRILQIIYGFMGAQQSESAKPKNVQWVEQDMELFLATVGARSAFRFSRWRDLHSAVQS